MVNYLKANLNDTDVVSDGSFDSSFWDSWYEGLYFSATTWATVDGGLSRIPASFHPLVDNYTTMGRKIERVGWDEETQQVSLQWRNNYTETDFQTCAYDYTVVAVPFSVVKNWRLPSLMSTTMTNAINHMPYGQACKVALEFSTRFWEHLDNPIIGSCSTSTDIPGIGSICYPSYNINGTGPATMLGKKLSSTRAFPGVTKILTRVLLIRQLHQRRPVGREVGFCERGGARAIRAAGHGRDPRRRRERAVHRQIRPSMLDP